MSKRRRKRGQGALSYRRISKALEPRLRNVGPEKFGILGVDSSKKHFAVLLTDFYGTELTGKLEFDNSAAGLSSLVETVQRLMAEHGLEDLVVAIERTGRYHVPVRDALRKHWTVVIVHPYVTKKLRQAGDPGNKTDLTDLRAMIRAAIIGYGTSACQLPDPWAVWRLFHREREDRVKKRAIVRVQVQERIEALLPGFTRVFKKLWQQPNALALAEHYGTAEALRAAGEEAILEHLRASGHIARRSTVARMLQWAFGASPPDAHAEVRHRLLRDQLALARTLDAQIRLYEAELARYLVDTPFILLLAIPGINVVSASGYGAELGPIEHYPTPRKIAGRAGLYPSRYQSDAVDHADGPLVKHGNARLRDALMEIAHNLVRCNEHFKAWAKAREERGWRKVKIRVALANKFARISYAMLAGRTGFTHPSMGRSQALLAKLVAFARGAGFEPAGIRDLLMRASRQLPKAAVEDEARALVELVPRRRRRPGPTTDSQPVLLGDVLREVIAHLAPGVALETERRADEPRKTRRASR